MSPFLVGSLVVVLATGLSACFSQGNLPEPAVSPDRTGDVTEARVLANTATGEEWLIGGADFSASHYSPLGQVNTDNVKDLGIAWATEIPVANGLVSEPIVVDGVMYVSGEFSKVFALDAASGQMLWQFDPKVRLDFSLGNSWASRSNRGVAVWKGKVYVGTGDCRLIAVSAGRGEQLWESPVCNPSEGDGAGITGAPRVGGDKVFMGYLASDTGARGSIVAFDAETGAELWRFWTVPGKPTKDEVVSPALKKAAETWTEGWAKQGGGAVWDAMTYDPETDLLYFGTASALPLNARVRDREERDNLYTNSIMAVNATTGDYVWHYQAVPADAWDYDAAMHIVLTDVTLKGTRKRVAITAPKNGFLYVLDARSGELLRADAIARNITWASHIDLASGRPVVLEQAEYYSEDLLGQTIQVFPGANGAHNWHASSYHKEHGLLYLPMIDLPGYFTSNDGLMGASFEPLGYRPDDEIPDSMGYLLAWDPVKGAARWSVDHSLPFNGGVLSTAGNLVFQGSGEGEFSAYDAIVGKKLWKMGTRSAIQSNPVTYQSAGEQYIAVTTGLGGGLRLTAPDRVASLDAREPAKVIAFKLGGKGTLPPGDERYLPSPEPPSLEKWTAAQVEQGELLWSTAGCEVCHGAHAMGIRKRELDGVIPDLRYAPAEVHEQWHAIVLGGIRRDRGMPYYGEYLTMEESEALHGYVVNQAWAHYGRNSDSSAPRNRQSPGPGP